MELAGAFPDVVIGCVGGGSNFAGLAFPFVREKIAGRDIDVLACEPAACPTLTRGLYAYDFGDTSKLTPLVAMHTLGHDFVPAPIHAGGLRYHGVAPLISQLVERRPDPRGGVPPERLLRVGGAVRAQRGDHPRARVVARDLRRDRERAARRTRRARSGRSSSTSRATATSTWPRTTTTSPGTSRTSRSTRRRCSARSRRSRDCRLPRRRALTGAAGRAKLTVPNESMKITADQLAQQVALARSRGWLPLIARAEKRHKLPAGHVARDRLARDEHAGHRRRRRSRPRPLPDRRPLPRRLAREARRARRGNDAAAQGRGRVRGGDARVEPRVRAAEEGRRGPAGALRRVGVQRRLRRRVLGLPGAATATRSTTGGDYGSDVLERLAAIQGKNGGDPTGGGGAILERGSRGPAVTKLKRDLKRWYDENAPGAWDAFKIAPGPGFGAALETAVKDFQVRNALDPDGQVGDATRTALARGSAPVPKPPPGPKPKPPTGGILEQGSKGPEVTQLKRDLQRWYDSAAPGRLGRRSASRAARRSALRSTAPSATSSAETASSSTARSARRRSRRSRARRRRSRCPIRTSRPTSPISSSTRKKKVGSKGQTVKLIQGWLCYHGFKVVVDGGYGKATARAGARVPAGEGAAGRAESSTTRRGARSSGRC